MGDAREEIQPGSLPNVFKEPLPDSAKTDAQSQLKDLLSSAGFNAAPAHRA